jgi:hypothetical protein
MKCVITKCIGSLLILLSFISCGKEEIRDHFKITFISSDNSLAYSTKTIITDSMAQYQIVGGLVGEKPRIVWEKALNKSQIDSFYNFLNKESLDTLRKIYNNPNIMDGMQLSFQIDYKSKNIEVQLGNIWIPSLLKLALMINTTLPDSLRYHFNLSVNS